MKVYFKTFGCRTNIYDSELMKSCFDAHELVSEQEAEIIVVNSCTVTNGADSDVRNYINKNQDKKIILAGCGALSHGKALFEAKNVFGVLSGENKTKIKTLLLNENNFFELGNLNYKESAQLSNFSNHTKAFLKIQEGCDFSCSYCIIPSVRGKSRSLDEQSIISQANKLAQNGFSELVLTGTNIGSYGKKTNSSLGILLQKLSKINGIKRIRLGSIEPSQIDESFKEILHEDWIERHLHIALQHCSQKMLNLMRRRNNFKSDLKLFEELSLLGFSLGTDFIVGHPGESEEIWEESLENFKKLPLTHLHAFVFSPRDNTISALMRDTIDKNIAKQRLKILKNIVFVNNLRFRKKQKDLKVLVENLKNDGFYSGFDQFYNKIKIKSQKDLSRKWLDIKQYEVRTDENYAEI